MGKRLLTPSHPHGDTRCRGEMSPRCPRAAAEQARPAAPLLLPPGASGILLPQPRETWESSCHHAGDTGDNPTAGGGPCPDPSPKQDPGTGLERQTDRQRAGTYRNLIRGFLSIFTEQNEKLSF